MKISAEVQFAQRLAANDKQDRDKAVRKLKKWFTSRSSGASPFQEDELLRVWKGLFYCFWMSDKPLIQEELAVSIAAMIDAFGSEESTLLFIKTFLTTMNREWFGIDKWRMDKFMMMTRRFLRQVFKYNKKHGWTEELTAEIRNTFADYLILSKAGSSNLGFQMHITDIFLEELAKVGGEDLDPTVLDIYLQPFLKVLSEGRDQRFRGHVVERIFHYLIRQSDCGIEWEMEKEVEALGNVAVLNGDAEEGDDEESEVNYEEMDDEDEEHINGQAEDPRAGRVDVELPQLQVDYHEMSQVFFELGSHEKTKVANRNILYKLSKFFKNVGDNVFPLGDTISDEEPDEGINISAAVNRALDKEEKIRKKNLKGKEEYKNIKKSLKANGQSNGLDYIEPGELSEETSTLKRKKEEEIEEEPPEVKKARIEENKLKKKEKERKRKQDLKRAKRERLLAERTKEGEEKRKAELLISRDIEVKAALDSKKDEPQKKKKKKLKQGENVDGMETAPTINSPDVKQKKEKKKKKKKLPSEEDCIGKKPSVETPTLDQNADRNKKKNKKKLLDTEDTAEAKEKSKLEVKKGKETTPLKAVDQKTNEESSCEITFTESGKKKKKKKDKKSSDNVVNNETETVAQNGHAKLFEESSDWDSPLLPGEQEIVLPNKKYKGADKLAPPAAEGFPDFSAPSVSTPNIKKSHTAVFLKKAMSKSATPKKKRLEAGVMKKDLTASEPKPKKVNFALTLNMSQEISDLYSSIASSPGIPHDPNKNPEKSLLKRTLESHEREPELMPVQLNTQLNSLSKKGKKLFGKKKRMQAKEFF